MNLLHYLLTFNLRIVNFIPIVYFKEPKNTNALSITNFNSLRNKIRNDSNENWKSRSLSSSNNCTEDEILIEIEATAEPPPYTDIHSWTLTNLTSDEIIMSDGPYSDNTTFQYRECILDWSYKFTFFDAEGTGFSLGYYSLSVNGHRIKSVSSGVVFSAEETIICTSDSDCYSNNKCSIGTCNLETRSCVFKLTTSFSENCRSFGSPTALVIRVIGIDNEPSTSAEHISDFIFGTNFSMMTQFSECAYQSFNITPYTGFTTNGVSVSKGVTEILISDTITGNQAGSVANQALAVANEVLGTIETQFEFVLLCLPPGTRVGISENWKAYAFINSYLSIYNDDACISTSVLMHEVGHNLGLSHSNDEANYGDESGYMGISYDRTDGPRKCFNAAKSYQLGWYFDSVQVIDLNSMFLNNPYEFNIIGIADYQRRNEVSGGRTIIRLLNGGDGSDYFLSFNRNIKMNSETGEGANAVLVTKQRTGGVYDDSTLLGKVSHENTFSVPKIQAGIDLWVSVYVNDYPFPYAVASINRANFTICTDDQFCDDDNICTIDKCVDYGIAFNLCYHEPMPCSDCGAMMSVDVITNDFPDKLSWSVENIVTNTIVKSSVNFEKSNAQYLVEECLPYGKYIFSLLYFENSTSSSNPATFELRISDYVADGDTLYEESYIDSYIIICETDVDCRDHDGCSIDICDKRTKLCNNTDVENLEDCAPCSWFSINITTDNFPEETKWSLTNSRTKETVISGDPYSFDLTNVFGRSKAPTRAGRRKAPTRSGRSKAPTRASPSRLLLDFDHLVPDRVLIEEEEEEEEEEIFEEMCLENKYLYYFIINDSFGDGICCSEGNGGYILKANDNILKQGGEFPYFEDSLFQFSICTSDDDCGLSSESCVVGTCLIELSLCTFVSLPCHACGALVNITVTTDFLPMQTSWKLSSNGKEILAGGSFTKSFQPYVTTACLTFNQYFFSIFDSAGDGMKACAVDCGYKIDINGINIITGKEYLAEASSFFTICSDDSQCNDSDPCTKDSCDREHNFCVFEPLPCSNCSNDPCDRFQSCIPSPCSECDKRLVTFYIGTDQYAYETSWKITNLDTKAIVMSAGPYWKLFSIYEFSQCLPEGFYELSILDSGSDGRHQCGIYDSSCGSFLLNVDETSVYGEGGFGSLQRECFEINLSTKAPTLSLRPSISNQPSVSPIKPETYYPTPSVLYYGTYSPTSSAWLHTRSPAFTWYPTNPPFPSTPYPSYPTTPFPTPSYWYHTFRPTSSLMILSFKSRTSPGAAAANIPQSCMFVPTSIPTSSLTPSMSPSAPSFVPSLLPSFLSEKPLYFNSTDTWFIDFEKTYPSATNQNLLDIFFLEYSISNGRSRKEINSTILDKGCSKAPIDQAIMISNITITRVSTSNKEYANVYLLFNESLIENSELWERKSEDFGVLSFCVRTELISDGEGVSFVETEMKIQIDFSAPMSNHDSLSLGKKDTESVLEETALKLSFCICNIISGTSYECVEDPVFEHNAQLIVCLLPLEDAIVKKFENVALYQNGIEKVVAVENGIPDQKTSVVTGSLGLFETKIVSTLFQNSPPLPVDVIGSISLQIRRRRLVDGEESWDLGPAEEIIEFQLRFSIKRNTYILSIGIFGTIFFILLRLIFMVFSCLKSFVKYDILPWKESD